MLRRANTGWKDGMFAVPSGHIEKMETPQMAGARELKEEAGVTVDPKDLEFVHVMFNKSSDGTDTERVSVFFRAKIRSDEPYVAEPEKADASGWYTLDNLPEIPDVLERALNEISQGHYYSELHY